MAYKILIADDEERIRILLSDFLKNEHYLIVEAADGDEAISKFYEDPSISLLILDVMMPKYNGFEVLDEIRKISQVPVIMLTARNGETDELKGFNCGADEYITKPFRPSILTARVKAILKRVYGQEDTLILGELSINILEHSVKVGGINLNLSLREYSLLTYLTANAGKALSREQILNNVWGYDYYGTSRTVDTHMNRLRIKLDNAGNYITTLRGYGYKFEVHQ